MEKSNKLFKFKNIKMAIVLILITGKEFVYSSDAYIHIRYSNAFNQETIYKEYKQLLKKTNCAKNLFSEISSDEISDQIELSPEDLKNLNNFERRCINKLENARLMTLIAPGMPDLLNTIIFSFGAFAIIKSTKNKKSKNMSEQQAMMAAMAQSSIIAPIFSALGTLPQLVKTGYQLLFRPDNFLASLEECYAKNKPYIPNILWNKIEETFVQARQIQSGKEKFTDFLQFALSFKIYKPTKIVEFNIIITVKSVLIMKLSCAIFFSFNRTYGSGTTGQHNKGV